MQATLHYPASIGRFRGYVPTLTTVMTVPGGNTDGPKVPSIRTKTQNSFDQKLHRVSNFLYKPTSKPSLMHRWFSGFKFILKVSGQIENDIKYVDHHKQAINARLLEIESSKWKPPFHRKRSPIGAERTVTRTILLYQAKLCLAKFSSNETIRRAKFLLPNEKFVTFAKWLQSKYSGT